LGGAAVGFPGAAPGIAMQVARVFFPC